MVTREERMALSALIEAVRQLAAGSPAAAAQIAEDARQWLAGF